MAIIPLPGQNTPAQLSPSGAAPQGNWDQQIQYYAGLLGQLSGTYSGNLKAYKGMTWEQIYTALANNAANKNKVNPQQLANAVFAVEVAQRVGSGVSAATTEMEKYADTTPKAAVKAVSQVAPDTGIPQAEKATSGLSNWLSGLGGEIGSGIEAGFTDALKDVWNVIIGPLEILAGIGIAFIIVMWALKDDLTKVAGTIAPLFMA